MSSSIDRESMRMWRHKHRLTQTEAAELIGVTRVSYQNWEHGHHQPQPKNAAKVLAAMARDDIQAGSYVEPYPQAYTLSESLARFKLPGFDMRSDPVFGPLVQVLAKHRDTECQQCADGDCPVRDFERTCAVLRASFDEPSLDPFIEAGTGLDWIMVTSNKDQLSTD